MDGKTHMNIPRILLGRGYLWTGRSNAVTLKSILLALAQNCIVKRCYRTLRTLMLGERACRIVQGQRSSSSNQGTSSGVTTGPAKLTTDQRLARWKIFVLKLIMVLDNFHLKKRTQAVLGKDAYLRIFHQVKDQGDAPPPQITNVINGEIVGKPLSPGEGTVEVDPTQCQHPVQRMKRHGNRSSKWWTCHACQSRWERMKAEDSIPTGTPKGTEILLFGKHVGLTFSHVFDHLPSYAQWVIRTAQEHGDESQPQLLRLAKYLSQRVTQAELVQTQSDTEGSMEEDA